MRYPGNVFRTLSTTTPLFAKTIKPTKLPRDLVPAYPYGERRVYKQSNRGLYGHARVRYGYNVSEKWFTKSQRLWRPNIHVKILKSKALGVRIRLRLTLRVLKTILREGGVDNYLLGTKPGRLQDLGPCGWGLRWLVMQTRAVQERFNEERIKLGLEPKEIEDKDHIIDYVLDRATPGPLNARSRATLASLRASMADAVVCGNDSVVKLS
ncbi:50S ribosomal protein L24 [Ophiocordyceps camponoti-floridani]|uniref:50S ribosomal protein L24 n=1 Tax=Ophiocordyceps camponoti-floridani TaxID=2030778 RepID=A0A8H4Q984_9HYPO|nr:50S ribosomal protein L24 [Ophiocordyceps camponoti-floridani]